MITSEKSQSFEVDFGKLRRSPRRGQQRSPTNRRQQLHQQPRSADEDDEEDEDLPINQSAANKFAEMQAASRRLERRLPELERRFHETGLSRQEVCSVSNLLFEHSVDLPS